MGVETLYSYARVHGFEVHMCQNNDVQINEKTICGLAN